ncbi:MAG: hypothetical protein ACXAE3_04370 [Candidatus Kariarchaeaceae archaeon]|jgi:hypothetical protein
MRFKLGVLAPFGLQIGITFLYSSIKYETLESSLIATVGLYIFPIFVMAILSPQFITIMISLRQKIADQIDGELDNLVISDGYGQEEGRTQLIENRFPSVGDVQTIGENIKSKLTPLLTERAVNSYQDNFYSRIGEFRQERSLEYFETMVLFAGLSMIFFIVNLLVVIIISFTSLDIYFIELNQIESTGITVNLVSIFGFGIVLTYYILEFAGRKVMYYLAYSVPVLFNEASEEQYLRRETIRSVVNYNFDNLIDRRNQRAIQSEISEVLARELNSLLAEEIMITARSEFARKLAWREYSKLIEYDILSKNKDEQSCLELLSIGEKVGPVKLDENHLLGLHSDVIYITNARNKWKELGEETRAFVYFQLYRVIEFVLKQAYLSLNLLKEDTEFNLFNAINDFYELGYMTKKEKNELHNLRYRRNRLMHEIGASLDVSQNSLEVSIDALESVLQKIKENSEDEINS